MDKKGTFEELAKAFELKTLPESEVEISGDVPAEVVGQYKDAALLEIASQLDLPGFRKGHVPPDVALKRVGEVAALEEAVELFVKDFYPELLDLKKVDAVGRPDIRITKLAPGNPIGLTIRAAVYPEVNLPKNWKSLEKDIKLEEAEPATEDEIKQTIDSLLKSRAVPPTKTVDDTGAPSAADAEGAPVQLPELTDEFAQSIGAFKTVDELKAQIAKGIGEEKQARAKDARRAKIIDKLLEETTVAVPAIFVESELDKIINQMREDVTRFGITYEDYLKQSSKTEEGVRNDFREQAKKRAKLQLTLNKIATDEKIEADKEAVDTEMQHALQHFPDANHALLRIHIETVLRNEKTLQLLEGIASPKNEVEAHNHAH
jgi:FKBP-type peptidyl-prolyl cis-trans isomerase (trigger factor)